MDARDIYAKFSRPGLLSPPPSPPKRVSFVRDADIEIFLDGSDSDDAPPGRVCRGIVPRPERAYIEGGHG